jgi:alkanesulfonate monooxygenase
MAKYGRAPDELKIMPGLLAVVGRSEQEAQDKYGMLQDMIHPLVGLAQLCASMGDLTGYDLDGPVPRLAEWRMRSRAQIFYDLAQRKGYTIRQLYTAIAAGNGHRQAIGTAVQIADQMEEWFAAEAADGFNVLATHMPAGLADFVDHVVPELQRRGLYRTAYEGRTLRESLGLQRPGHRVANPLGHTATERVG